MQCGEIVRAERMVFDGNEMQVLAVLRILTPGLPGGEEVETEAEAVFQDDEAFAAPPALRQSVAGNEHGARLAEAAGSGGVDVVVGFGVRGAFGGEG